MNSGPLLQHMVVSSEVLTVIPNAHLKPTLRVKASRLPPQLLHSKLWTEMGGDAPLTGSVAYYTPGALRLQGSIIMGSPKDLQS